MLTTRLCPWGAACVRRHLAARTRAFASAAALPRRRTINDAPLSPVTLAQSECASERDLRFQLFEVLGMEETLRRPQYSHVDADDVVQSLRTAIAIADNEFLPLRTATDEQEPTLDSATGEVSVAPGVAEALEAFRDAGFFAVGADPELGGSGLPCAASTALFAPFNGACVGVASYAFLTIAAGNLLAKFGSEDQVQRYLQPMLEGRFFGTMNLSEPQAGSSLGDIRTTATPLDDDAAAAGAGARRYSIKGSKMWISGGEQPLSESIVHLVLAKVPGGPPGVKGISLFIVPKHHIGLDADGNAVVGDRNDVHCAGLNHKMGWRGTVNTVMQYGESSECIGYLVGEEGQGLAIMFQMMNEARVGIGQCAVMIGYAGYAASLRYALERTQGRLPGSKDPTSPPVAIAKHADVRRMLLAQKAYVEGGLSLCLYAASLVDDQETADTAEEREAAALLLDTLTPIVKAWPSEWCLEANKWAIQCLGGYGYTRDFPLEQLYRDNRLNKIHEGTDGIQALDLLGRKAVMHGGRGLQLLAAEITRGAAEAVAAADAAPVDADVDALRDCAGRLLEAAGVVGSTTAELVSLAAGGDPDLMLANAHEYLQMTGHTVVAWLWLRQATAAAKAMHQQGFAAGAGAGAGDDETPEESFYRGKLAACRYFFTYQLPAVHTLSGVLLRKDDLMLTLSESWL